MAGRHIVCLVTEARITSHTFLCINLFQNHIITVIHVQVQHTYAHMRSATPNCQTFRILICSKYFPKWLETRDSFSDTRIHFDVCRHSAIAKKCNSLSHSIGRRRIWIHLSCCRCCCCSQPNRIVSDWSESFRNIHLNVICCARLLYAWHPGTETHHPNSVVPIPLLSNVRNADHSAAMNYNFASKMSQIGRFRVGFSFNRLFFNANSGLQRFDTISCRRFAFGITSQAPHMFVLINMCGMHRIETICERGKWTKNTIWITE